MFNNKNIVRENSVYHITFQLNKKTFKLPLRRPNTTSVVGNNSKQPQVNMSPRKSLQTMYSFQFLSLEFTINETI